MRNHHFDLSKHGGSAMLVWWHKIRRVRLDDASIGNKPDIPFNVFDDDQEYMLCKDNLTAKDYAALHHEITDALIQENRALFAHRMKQEADGMQHPTNGRGN